MYEFNDNEMEKLIEWESVENSPNPFFQSSDLVLNFCHMLFGSCGVDDGG